MDNGLYTQYVFAHTKDWEYWTAQYPSVRSFFIFFIFVILVFLYLRDLNFPNFNTKHFSYVNGVLV